MTPELAVKFIGAFLAKFADIELNKFSTVLPYWATELRAFPLAVKNNLKVLINKFKSAVIGAKGISGDLEFFAKVVGEMEFPLGVQAIIMGYVAAANPTSLRQMIQPDNGVAITGMVEEAYLNISDSVKAANAAITVPAVGSTNTAQVAPAAPEAPEAPAAPAAPAPPAAPAAPEWVVGGHRRKSRKAKAKKAKKSHKRR